jgi:hypothetical protein
MIGETDFAKAQCLRLSGVFGGCTGGMAAEGRVHVIIGRHDGRIRVDGGVRRKRKFPGKNFLERCLHYE